MSVILLILVSDGNDLSANVLVKFTNNKQASVEIFVIKSQSEQTAKKILTPGETYGLRCAQGERLKVQLGKSQCLYFEATESGQQQIELGKSHSTFQLYGWQIHLNDKLWIDTPELTQVWFDLMVGQLNRVVEVVPRKALAELRQVPIWVNPPYKNFRPTAEYHPNANWLKENNRDPQMAKSIEITTVDNFAFENVRMPMLMLHELSHAYHDRVLSFRHPGIRTRFDAAKKSGSYDSVDRFTGRKIIKDKAYAMSNDREYFAESSEAFFGKNDFYPFNRKQLLDHDEPMHNLLVKLWGEEIE